MDFGIYPPEINSGRMYAGPGSGPMLAAAQAWSGLADELYTAAGSYQSVVSELTSGLWSGPSSTAMAAAASSYVTWLSRTAAQAEETAAQTAAAAAAYESAFASTVPPPEIAANRSLLLALVATNFFGQNTPAIAATEVQYAGMWAQDAVAMYGYAAASASATALTPFSSPQQSTDPGATISQAAAVSQAASTSAGDTQSIVASVPQTFSAVPATLQSLATAAPAATSSPILTFLNVLNQLITVTVGIPGEATNFLAVPLGILAGPVDAPVAISSFLVSGHEDGIASGWDGVVPWPDVGPAPPTAFPAIITGAGQTAASASVAEANTVGKLSVPPGWTVAAPEIRPAAFSSPITSSFAPVGQALEAGSANTFNQMGIGGMAGQAMAGPPAPAATEENGKAVTHARLTNRVVGGAGTGDVEATPAPRTVMTGVAAAIRDIAKLRAEGRLTEQEYNEQKKRLLHISFGQ